MYLPKQRTEDLDPASRRFKEERAGSQRRKKLNILLNDTVERNRQSFDSFQQWISQSRAVGEETNNLNNPTVQKDYPLKQEG